jgi:hypothetical protein
VYVSTLFMLQRRLSKTADFSDNGLTTPATVLSYRARSKVLSCKELCVPLWIFILVLVFLCSLPNQLMSENESRYLLQEEIG